MLESFASAALRSTITRLHKSRIGGRQFLISPLGSTTFISTHNYSSTTLQLYTKQQINTYDWYQQMNGYSYDHSSKQNLDPLSMNRRFYSYSSKSNGDNKEETKLSTSKGEPDTTFENLSFKEKANSGIIMSEIVDFCFHTLYALPLLYVLINHHVYQRTP